MNQEKALITGATSGIGEALARLFAKKGFRLILTGRNSKKLEALNKELKAYSCIVCDLADRNQRGVLIQEIHKQLPELIINNAGFGIYGDALTIPVSEQLIMLEVNSTAVLEITLESARSLIQAGKKGLILNVSSIAGEFPCPGMSVYGAAKSFVTQVSSALNTELSSHGVSILTSCPGMVSSDFANRAAKRPIKIKKGPIMTPEFAAEQIWKQIENKKEKNIFHASYRMGALFAKHFIPISWTKKVIWTQIKQRI